MIHGRNADTVRNPRGRIRVDQSNPLAGGTIRETSASAPVRVNLNADDDDTASLTTAGQ